MHGFSEANCGDNRTIYYAALPTLASIFMHRHAWTCDAPSIRETYRCSWVSWPTTGCSSDRWCSSSPPARRRAGTRNTACHRGESPSPPVCHRLGSQGRRSCPVQFLSKNPKTYWTCKVDQQTEYKLLPESPQFSLRSRGWALLDNARIHIHTHTRNKVIRSI